ncbi:hypothetical protein TNCV_1989601 [Trichonephila clavipes]|nr:hypothetical protein TNCV_1989601 [Trichonephila clavipes]
MQDVKPQGRSYHGINDTGPPSCMGSNMCNFSPTNRAPLSKKEPRKNLACYVSGASPHFHECVKAHCSNTSQTILILVAPFLIHGHHVRRI